LEVCYLGRWLRMLRVDFFDDAAIDQPTLKLLASKLK
jgi:hypothetical protein